MIKSVFRRWSKRYVCLLLIVNVVLAVTNIIVLSFSFPSNIANPYYFDYYGVIIGILSVLVTVLLGWNIFSVIDFRVKLEKVEKESEKIVEMSNKIDDMEKELKVFEQEYYDRIKKVESSFIETSFDIYHAKPDETIIVIVMHGLEVVLWLAQMGDFDKACEVLRLVYIGINKRKPFTIPAGYAKNFNILIVELSRYAMIAKTVEYNDLRDRCKISWDDLNRFNKNINKE